MIIYTWIKGIYIYEWIYPIFAISINVYNNLGQLLITENTPTSINLSSYSRGVYMLHIIQNNKIITKQIIKE